MADYFFNFSCSDPDLRQSSIEDGLWRIEEKGSSHRPSIIALGVIQVLYVLIGLPWNAIVLTVILIKKLFKDFTYIFLINMVLADLLALLVLPFNIASAFPMKFVIGDSDFARCQACHGIIVLTLTFTNASLFFLAWLSVDRLIYVQWPLMYPKIISKKSIIPVVVITWIVCLVISLPPVFGFGEIKFANPIGSCSLIATGTNRVAPNIVYVFVLLGILSFPLVAALAADIWLLIIVCKGMRTRYTKTRRSIKSMPHQQRRDSEAKIKGGYHKKQLIIIQVFGIIFGINIITWIPTTLITLVSLIVGADNISIWWFSFVYIIYVSQPAIHPILETCLVGKARQMVFKVLCCCKTRRPHLVTKSSNMQLPSIS